MQRPPLEMGTATQIVTPGMWMHISADWKSSCSCWLHFWDCLPLINTPQAGFRQDGLLLRGWVGVVDAVVRVVGY